MFAWRAPSERKVSGRIYHTIATLLLGLTLISGCSGSAGQVGCEDLVRTVGDVAERCGFDRAVNEQAFESNATAGFGCEEVDSLRDEAAFYDACIPFFEDLTCAEFDDPAFTLPASCQMQLRVER